MKLPKDLVETFILCFLIIAIQLSTNRKNVYLRNCIKIAVILKYIWLYYAVFLYLPLGI